MQVGVSNTKAIVVLTNRLDGSSCEDMLVANTYNEGFDLVNPKIH